MNTTATCAICDTEILIIPDSVMKFCKCKCLGVDCCKEYTNYSGTIRPNYAEWYEQHKITVQK